MPDVKTHDGVELVYDVAGPADASPVVLLHGLSSSRDTWHDVAARLASSLPRLLARSAWSRRVGAHAGRVPRRGLRSRRGRLPHERGRRAGRARRPLAWRTGRRVRRGAAPRACSWRVPRGPAALHGRQGDVRHDDLLRDVPDGTGGAPRHARPRRVARRARGDGRRNPGVGRRGLARRPRRRRCGAPHGDRVVALRP